MLDNFAKPISDTTKELIKPIYDDVAHPSASAVGKALGTVTNCLNMLLAPLERAQLTSAAKTEAFRKSLEIKYQVIPEDRRQEPPLKIVYQIADKLKYNLDNDELRDLFENLLISSMTKGITIHPIFVDVIDKMMPEDARLFKFIATPSIRKVGMIYTELFYKDKASDNKKKYKSRNHFLHIACPQHNKELSDLKIERLSDFCKTFYEKDEFQFASLPKGNALKFHIKTLLNLGMLTYGRTKAFARATATVKKSITDKGKGYQADAYHKYFDFLLAENGEIKSWIDKEVLASNDSTDIMTVKFEANEYTVTDVGTALFNAIFPENSNCVAMFTEQLDEKSCTYL